MIGSVVIHGQWYRTVGVCASDDDEAMASMMLEARWWSFGASPGHVERAKKG